MPIIDILKIYYISIKIPEKTKRYKYFKNSKLLPENP